MSERDQPTPGAGFLGSLLLPDQRRYRCAKGRVTVGRFYVQTFAPDPSFAHPPTPEWESGPLCRICWAQQQARDCEAVEITDEPGT